MNRKCEACGLYYAARQRNQRRCSPCVAAKILVPHNRRGKVKRSRDPVAVELYAILKKHLTHRIRAGTYWVSTLELTDHMLHGVRPEGTAQYYRIRLAELWMEEAAISGLDGIWP